MPRWMRVIRGMIGTGLTFAVGVGVLGSIVGLVALLLGQASLDDLRMVAKLSAVAFLVGVAFSGVLAIAARARTFEKLSLRYVSALGAGAGLLYFLFIGLNNGFKVWTAAAGFANLTILAVMGAGSAAAMLILARKAKATLAPGDETRSLGEGSLDAPLARDATEEKMRR